MIEFLNGMTTMGFIVAVMFFARFWRRTKDPLFLTFAGAFCLLALNQVLIGVSAIAREDESLLYLLRLTAFALLILAIVWKNVTTDAAGKP